MTAITCDSVGERRMQRTRRLSRVGGAEELISVAGHAGFAFGGDADDEDDDEGEEEEDGAEGGDSVHDCARIQTMIPSGGNKNEIMHTANVAQEKTMTMRAWSCLAEAVLFFFPSIASPR
jgi:hypothetical protein